MNKVYNINPRTSGRTYLIFSLVILVSSVKLYAQQTWCGFDQRYKSSSPPPISIIAEDSHGKMVATLDDDEIVRIPVVVHIVYNTDEENIPDSKVFEQIDILNEHFRARNPDQSDIIDDFKTFVGDAKIEFYLATEDPQGRSTTGITRTFTTRTDFDGKDKTDPVKFNATGGKDGWDRTRYLNIWVCDINPGSSFVGIATLASRPMGDKDGVIVDYAHFGTFALAGRMGRVAVHEVGHYLNLFHTFNGAPSPGNCDRHRNDEVFDTPKEAGRGLVGCRTDSNTCESVETIYGITKDFNDMAQNHMQFSNERCRLLFTRGQVARMREAIVRFRPGFLPTTSTCPPEITITSGAASASAGVRIVSTAQVLGAVQYRAGEEVLLKDGFLAAARDNNGLAATIGPCVAPPAPKQLPEQTSPRVAKDENVSLTPDVAIVVVPERTMLQIQSWEPVLSYEIYTLGGKRIHQNRILEQTESVRVSTDIFRPGIYLVKVSTENKVTVKKFIVQ